MNLIKSLGELFGEQPRESREESDRWDKYPDEDHTEHHRATTHAERVNYCYDCEKHYRPIGDDVAEVSDQQ